jgi:hypothetical protein
MPALKTRARDAGRFGWLLLALLALLAISSIATPSERPLKPLSVAFSATLAAGVYSARRRRRVLVAALALALPALVFEWVSNSYPTTSVELTNLTLLGCFVAFVAAVIFSEVLHEKRVSLDTIFGGIAIYLLIGVGWSLGYAVIEHLAPGSYPFANLPLQELRATHEAWFPELVYFSFVTMTTLGYGDMVPTTQPARVFAVLEAVVGQLYVAIFIARLVALHLTDQQRERRGED